jgi:hypothetical protein
VYRISNNLTRTPALKRAEARYTGPIGKTGSGKGSLLAEIRNIRMRLQELISEKT